MTIHEVLELMSAVTKDKRFEEAMKEYEGQKGEVSMSEIALDKIEARGERKVIERALRKGNSPKIIAEITSTPIDVVLKIQKIMLEEAK